MRSLLIAPLCHDFDVVELVPRQHVLERLQVGLLLRHLVVHPHAQAKTDHVGKHISSLSLGNERSM